MAEIANRLRIKTGKNAACDADALGFVDQLRGHLRFASAGAASGAGCRETSLSPFTDEGGFVLGHQREHPEHQRAVRGGGVHDPVAQRADSDAAARA